MKVPWATLFKLCPRNTVLAYKIVALYVPDESIRCRNLNIGVWSEKSSHVEHGNGKVKKHSETRVSLLMVCIVKSLCFVGLRTVTNECTD